MTATDELRRLLDERGVEWTAPNSCLRDEMTSWAAGGFYYDAFEVPEPDGTFLLTAAHQDDLTPTQAVEATLGRGTCHDTQEDEERFCCSVCGSRSHIATEYRKFDEYGNKSEHFLFVDNPRFCPSCGREVVDA